MTDEERILNDIKSGCWSFQKDDIKTISDSLKKQIAERPMLMQMAEPEYMCVCGFKMYYTDTPNYCVNCGQKLTK